MTECKAKIIGISRHRLTTDGDGVTTLAAFHGCPLRCRYCLNPHSINDSTQCSVYTPERLLDETEIDDLYFVATGGGVTFGGGEPCLHPEFINEFHDQCNPQWRISIETSLNVAHESIKRLLPIVDYWIIDIKDMNPDIYRAYTGKTNDNVIANLKMIAESGNAGKCMIRLPLIPEFNTESDRELSRRQLEALGFDNFDLFTYIIRHKL